MILNAKVKCFFIPCNTTKNSSDRVSYDVIHNDE